MAEYRAAFASARAANERKIIVIRLDESDPPPLLRSIRYIPYTTADAVASEVDKIVRATDLTQESTAAPAERSPVETQWVKWETIQDSVMGAVIRELVSRRNEMLTMARLNGKVSFKLLIAGGATITFDLERPFLEDELLFLELQSELKNYAVVNKIAASLRRRLLQGGLGIFEAPFEIELEERQNQLSEINGRLRGQLSAIAPQVVVSSAMVHS
jgi:hypothetical protein